MNTTLRINIKNMTCNSCEGRIERAVSKLPGIKMVQAKYGTGQVLIEYDTELLDQEMIEGAITRIGYEIGTSRSDIYKKLGIFLVFGLLLFLTARYGNVDLESRLAGNMSFVVLFTIGLISSLHCTGMCGGLMLSQSLSTQEGKRMSSALSAISYHAGRVISYTILGGVVGALGSVISFSLTLRAAIMIFAGVFMVFMGLNMGGFKIARFLTLKLPWKINLTGNRKRGSFVVGLLNGLMPCGPLQTIQLYALGTGSALAGAASMLAFALGTVPLMLGFGIFASFLQKGYTRKILHFSGVLVIVLGLVMTNRGLALAGINPLRAKPAGQTSDSTGASLAVVSDGYQTLKMTADNRGYVPNILVVQKDIPVRWVVAGEELNSCNNALVLPSLNIQEKLNQGETIIEFTPTKSGDLSFSCWMGMIRGTIKVVDDLQTADISGVQAPAASGGSCCTVGG